MPFTIFVIYILTTTTPVPHHFVNCVYSAPIKRTKCFVPCKFIFIITEFKLTFARHTKLFCSHKIFCLIFIEWKNSCYAFESVNYFHSCRNVNIFSFVLPLVTEHSLIFACIKIKFCFSYFIFKTRRSVGD